MDDALLVVMVSQFVVIALLAALLSGLAGLRRKIAPLLAKAERLLGSGGPLGGLAEGKIPKPKELMMYGAAQLLPELLPEIRAAATGALRGIVGMFQPGGAGVAGGIAPEAMKYVPAPVIGPPVVPKPVPPHLPTMVKMVK